MIYKAKKSLGQNFLKSEPALNMMCEAGEVSDKDTVLEIGPGKGALTKKLLEKAKRVIAVEKDHDLFEFLQEKFADEIRNKKLELINDDILEFDPNNCYLLRDTSYKLIANIPYNITGAIFRKFLSNSFQPEKMVLLVQKEVADRIVARAAKNKNCGKESILSLSVKAYGDPKYIMKVHKRFFSPSPKVDSAIISISNISKNNFKTKEGEEMFFKIIKTGFAHKRKVLIKNLEDLEFRGIELPEIFEKLKINPKTRAEDISIEKWLEISDLLSTGL